MLADGYKLVATGKAADNASEGTAACRHGTTKFWHKLVYINPWSMHARCKCKCKSARFSARAALPDDAPEVDMDGWNTELPDSYAFLYTDDTGEANTNSALHALHLCCNRYCCKVTEDTAACLHLSSVSGRHPLPEAMLLQT